MMNGILMLVTGMPIILLLYKWTQLLYSQNSDELQDKDKWLAKDKKMRQKDWLKKSLYIFAAFGIITVIFTNKFSFINIGNVLLFSAYLGMMLNFLYSDLDQQVIFDKQLVLFACLGLAGALLNHYPLADHLLAAGAGLLGFLLLSVVTRGSIGGGDIKLMGALGLWLGLKAIWLVAVGGILLGGIWALLLILCKKKGRKDFVPYSPGFILCGIIVYLLK